MINLMITDLANMRHAEMIKNAEEYRRAHPVTNKPLAAARTWRVDLGKLHINVYFGNKPNPLAQV